jgi:hypothetical protein
MHKSDFARIYNVIVKHGLYFEKVDGLEQHGLSSITSALGIFKRGVSADFVNEHVKIGGLTAIKYFKQFAHTCQKRGIEG